MLCINHACNLTIQDNEARALQAQDQPGLYSEEGKQGQGRSKGKVKN